jgi:hypothetical protein
MAILQNLTVSDTGFLRLPRGTTAERPASPAVGMIRFNTTTNTTEFYNGTRWRSVNRSTTAAVTGTVSTFDVGIYRVHVFTGAGNITFSNYSEQVEYLIVAGGGGGGNDHGGGGGGGGVLQGIFLPALGTSYSAVIGSGGAGAPAVRSTAARGSNGQDSSIFGFTATGGGGGGGSSADPGCNGQNGGSGGGSSGYGNPRTPGNGTTGQGHNGGQGFDNADEYQGGGGGGAGQPGRRNVNPRGRDVKGGDGRPSTITGTLRYFGGGGGGNATYSNGGDFGRGGLGGGGRGHTNSSSPGFNSLLAESGVANTGGGGGGANRFSPASLNTTAGVAGSGGSGIVIVKYIRQG